MIFEMDKDMFNKTTHQKVVLTALIKYFVLEAADMDRDAIADCLETEEGTHRAVGVKIESDDPLFEGRFDNVFRLRIHGKEDILVMVNRD